MMLGNEKKAEVLEHAIEVITPPHAWCKGTYSKNAWDPTTETWVPAACLMGAIYKGTHHVGVPSYMTSEIIDLLSQDIIDRGQRNTPFSGECVLTNWNDAQRDKRKVIRLLRRVAKQLRQGVQA